MEHGRGHDERQYKAARPRRSNVPPDEPEADLEAELSESGRHGVAPPKDLAGAPPERARGGGEEAAPVASGSDVAPTERAARRERERHRLEREIGRVAAGTQGKRRDDRRPFVDRASLDGVAREADRRMTEAKRPVKK